MARIIKTEEARPDDFPDWDREMIYNGLDCCVTLEVHEVINPQLDNHTAATYNFERALQGPVLEMKLRGMLVDQRRKNEVIDEYMDLSDRLERQLDEIVLDGVGLTHFSWRSNPDLHRLFYDTLGIPTIRKGGRPTVDRNALEKMEEYLIARPIVRHIQALRDLQKKIGFLRTGIDPDGRIRTSLNIAGTSTGRFSSSFSEFGTGTNLQNVEESLRSVLIADKGMKFAKFDGQQAQSRIVGAIEWNIFKDGRYLDTCESSDLHTMVAKMCWPELPWTGDLAKDREIAEQPYYRHYDYRFMCKKLGHGSNFIGKPPALSLQAKLPLNIVVQFQPKYYSAFPAHLQWHDWVRSRIWEDGYLISLGGRKRYFWGRRNEEKTIREAVAYDAQETESHIINNGLLNVWRHRDALVMHQDHDAVVVMYPEAQEAEIIPKIVEQLRWPIVLNHDRVFEIPYEAKVGWNLGKYDYKNPEKNPDGLKEYDFIKGDQRRRTPEVGILDRRIHRAC